MNKMLGVMQGDAVVAGGFAVSAHANRVATEHGHLVCLSIGLERKAPLQEIIQALHSWRGAPAALSLPSAPARALVITLDPDRPQTRRDVWAGNGMTVTVGRIRPDPIFDVKLVALGHNTIRGAAGGSVLNAELLVARGDIATS